MIVTFEAISDERLDLGLGGVQTVIRYTQKDSTNPREQVDFPDDVSGDMYRCAFFYEGRITRIEGTVKDSIISAKMWLLSHLDWLIDNVSRDACDEEITKDYLNTYLQAVATITENSKLYIEDGFYIALFYVPEV